MEDKLRQHVRNIGTECPELHNRAAWSSSVYGLIAASGILRAQKNRIFGCIVASLVARTVAVFH